MTDQIELNPEQEKIALRGLRGDFEQFLAQLSPDLDFETLLKQSVVENYSSQLTTAWFRIYLRGFNFAVELVSDDDRERIINDLVKRVE